MNRIRIIEWGAFVALGVIAIAGWVRSSDHTRANTFISSPSAQQAYGTPDYTNPTTAAPQVRDNYEANSPYSTGANLSQPANTDNQPAPPPGDYQAQNQPASYNAQANPCALPVQSAAFSQPYYSEPYYSSTRPVSVRRSPTPVVQREVVRESRPVRRRGRSTGKSVALVAGSAGTGAAIGALAGGGKGAGIGALAGGAAGFIYDRFTHKTHSGL